VFLVEIVTKTQHENRKMLPALGLGGLCKFPPDFLTRGSAPGLHWGLCPQNLIIGSRSTLTMDSAIFLFLLLPLLYVSRPPCTCLCVCVYLCAAVYNSVNADLEREKELRLEAETKQKQLHATQTEQQQKLVDLEARLRDLEAAKVSDTWHDFSRMGDFTS